MTVQLATCSGGRLFGRTQHADAVAHPLRRLDKHPAQLAAADHPQRRGWEKSAAVAHVGG